MQTIGLLPHIDKPEALEAAGALLAKLLEAGLDVRLTPDIAGRLGRPVLGVPMPAFTEGLDLAVSLGGDGALLRAAKQVYPRQVPVFGINLGHLGFLAEVEAGRMDEAVQKLKAGAFRVEERLMVSAVAAQTGAAPLIGLNDVIIVKSDNIRMIDLEIILNGVAVTSYRADGLIVATPTGSTAYSLSAGGPILHPAVSAFVLTPVCAHSLHARPLVVGAQDSIAARVVAAHGEVLLIADGGETVPLAPGMLVSFGRAAAVTRLLRFSKTGFYETLRQRFEEGKI